MSLEENKAIVRRWIEDINRRNLAILDELVAPDFFHSTFQLRGPEGTKQFYAMFLKGFPDCHEALEDIVAEGDRVWHRFTTTGAHTGEFEFGGMTLPPTGKKFTMTGVNFWRIVDGKVVEKGGVSDQLDFLQKLGVIEYTEKAKKLFPEEVS
ncbi:MAG: ester cyclase [Candidatus Bathyarchaeia archaeon]